MSCLSLGNNKSFVINKHSSEKIIALINSNPRINIKEIAEKLQLSARAIEKAIASLKLAGKLKRLGNIKGGSWVGKKCVAFV